jgi:hypothetical protein
MTQLLISIGGGISIVVLLFLLDVEGIVLSPPNAVVKVLLWPVAVCLYLVGPGPRIGPPDKNFHEWTPVHSLALMVGIGLSWVFYTGLVFAFMKSRSRHNASAPSQA